jgi:hypothetical protein
MEEIMLCDAAAIQDQMYADQQRAKTLQQQRKKWGRYLGDL